MREILFRGQLRRKGEKVNMAGEPLPSIWKYGGVGQYGGGAVIYQAEPEIEKFPVYADTVGQYTGLTGKNGVKIFDGDIVRTLNGKKMFKVVWDGYCALYVLESLTDTVLNSDFINFYGYELEVIGNVYDNPELLGGADNA